MSESHRGACRITGPDECRRILLVGELNPYGVALEYALYHQPGRSAGGRLQRLIFGIDARRWYLPMWRVNLCLGEWDGRNAVRKAAELAAPGAPWTTIVMLGVKVATAFEVATVAMAEDRPSTVSLPHPSGRNASAWNAVSIAVVRSTMRAIDSVIPWGELER